MNYYCTLFDSNYLTRGLTLYESLLKTGESFYLYIFSFDDLTFNILQKLGLKHVKLITLSEFENEDLLNVKKERSKAEYCWTCTSHVIRYILENEKLDMITYLDADLYFFQSPSLLLDEFLEEGASILITEHRYTPKYDRSKRSGIYCVQFITFKADERGMKALKWWQERCIEWCYARAEDGKFGDQKYLDDWPERFEGVHTLLNLGGGLAPWNIQQYGPFQNANNLFLKEKSSQKEFKAIFYHFHQLIYYNNGSIYLGPYHLTNRVKKLIYKPYIRHLERIKQHLRDLEVTFNPNEKNNPPSINNLKFKVKYIINRLMIHKLMFNKDNLHHKDELIES